MTATTDAFDRVMQRITVINEMENAS